MNAEAVKCKKARLSTGLFTFKLGAPGRIRTHDPLVRSQVLYPTELRALKKKIIAYSINQSSSQRGRNFAQAAPANEMGIRRCPFQSNLARPAGFEPTTPWFVARYSIQLSYGRICLHDPIGDLATTGGEGGIRTHGRLAPTPDFESGTFDHSATSPTPARASLAGGRIIRRKFRAATTTQKFFYARARPGQADTFAPTS